MIFGKKKTAVLRVSGMKCSHCAASVKSALEKIRGVTVEIDLDAGTATVQCPEKTDVADLAAAVTAAGFAAEAE